MECLYPNNDYLRHTFESGICIPPGKSYDMTFTFCPREAKKYVETVQFEINGLSKQSVQISGTGTELKVRFYGNQPWGLKQSINIYIKILLFVLSHEIFCFARWKWQILDTELWT